MAGRPRPHPVGYLLAAAVGLTWATNAVGGGTFWSGMVDFTSGAKTAQQVADDIEKSWPQ